MQTIARKSIHVVFLPGASMGVPATKAAHDRQITSANQPAEFEGKILTSKGCSERTEYRDSAARKYAL